MRTGGDAVVYGRVAVGLLPFAFAAALSGCGRPADPAPAVAVAPAADPPSAQPSLAVEAGPERTPVVGTEYRIWTLKAAGLKRLSAKLVYVADGKSETLADVEYKWDKWEPTAPAATGQMLLLIQDGGFFGAKGKRRPVLDLDLRGSPDHSRVGKTTGQTLDGDSRSPLTTASMTSPLGRKSVLWVRMYEPATAPVTGAYSLSSDDEASLTAAAKGGRSVLAVVVEWEPRAGN